MDNIELGDTVVDSVTGYVGTVTVISLILGGPTQMCVERLHPEGNMLENWVNSSRLRKTEVVEA